MRQPPTVNPSPADVDPARFEVHRFDGRGFSQAFVREGIGGVPLLLVHGWPETKRVYWRVIEPLAAAGFEVIVPDLRGFGDSDVAPDGFHDVPASSRDLEALVRHLGHDRVVLCGGDLGGPVVQDMALRFPELADRLCLFNSPLPYDKEAMRDLDTRPAREASDYFLRQGTDADALAAELPTEHQRRRYIATFYMSRFWAHPGAFMGGPGLGLFSQFGGTDQVDFHTEPFGDAAKLRAGFGAYEASFDPAKQSEPPILRNNPDIRALLLFGASDRVIYPDFDRMAAVVFPDHVGPRRLERCGHFVPWEAPQALVDGLVELAADLLG